jgi:hypothetical protein
MQGAHDWYKTLNTTFNELGYIKSCADSCVWFKEENNDYIITDTYTNNIFGASKSDEEIKRRKGKIGGVWDIKDVGNILKECKSNKTLNWVQYDLPSIYTGNISRQNFTWKM